MKQYRVYLIAELGKLRDVGPASDFINAIGPAVLAELGLPPQPEGLAARLPDHDSVVAFVDSLPDGSLVGLVEACDERWRHNGVSARLGLGSSWSIREVPVGDVYVLRAEPSLGTSSEATAPDWSASRTIRAFWTITRTQAGRRDS